MSIKKGVSGKVLGHAYGASGLPGIADLSESTVIAVTLRMAHTTCPEESPKTGLHPGRHPAWPDGQIRGSSAAFLPDWIPCFFCSLYITSVPSSCVYTGAALWTTSIHLPLGIL